MLLGATKSSAVEGPISMSPGEPVRSDWLSYHVVNEQECECWLPKCQCNTWH